jgi:hypothetical protein
MWQIHWMLNLIPSAVLNWIYWAIIAAGLTGLVASWIGKWIPFYGRYATILKPVGIALLVLGVWLRGSYDTEMIWRERVAEMEQKVQVAEAKSQETNVVIQEKIVEKEKIVTQYVDLVKTEIQVQKEYIDKDCKISDEAINVYNKSLVGPNEADKK